MPEKTLKSRSSLIAMTLAGLALLVICLAAIWFLMIGGRKSIAELGLTSSSDNFTELSTSNPLILLVSSSTPPAIAISNPVPNSAGIVQQQHLTATTTTSTIFSTVQETLPSEPSTELFPPTARPENEVTVPTKAQNVPFCEFPSDFNPTCPQIRQSMANDRSNTFLQQKNMDVQLSTLIRPVKYALNLSIVDKTQHLMAGSLDLLLEVLIEGNSMGLHAGRNIRFIEHNKIFLWLCGEEQPLCPKSVTRLMDKQLLIIGLGRTLKQGTVIRLKIGKFESEIASNPGLTIQIPSKWEKERAWILASYNLDNGSRLVYPGVDEQNVMAILNLCIQHPKDTLARSNMPKRSAVEDESWKSTCFQESPFMKTKQFAFLLFENLKLISDVGNVEVFVGKHLQPENCQWIVEEASKALQKMAFLTSAPYPLEKLTIASIPLASDATHNLGLIQIKETWIEYPKYFYPHSLLISQVVQQWSNVLTLCDKCIQDGLATYLEWIITSEFVIDGQSTNISQRFDDVRNRLLHSENILKTGPSLLSANTLRPTNTNQCADRAAVVLYMLQKVYGRRVISDFLAIVFKRFSWTSCVPTRLLSNVFEDASGSKEAKQVFDSFFLMPPTVLDYPLLHIHLHTANSSLVISQQQQKNTSKDFNQLYAVPLEVVDDSRQRTSLVLNVDRLVSHRAAEYVLVEPDSYARHIYNVENYAKLIECLGEDGTKCSAISESALTSTFSDLCWALLNNKIKYQSNQVSEWRNIFDKLNSQPIPIVHGDCACCIQPNQWAKPKGTAKAQCRWTWRDKCSRISLLAEMA